MAREGTRSQTGNSKPRIFPAIDTAPTVKRTTKPKSAKKAAPKPAATGVKPEGVTKKKPAKSENGIVKKVKAATTKKASKAENAAKPAKGPKSGVKAKPASVK